MVKADLNIRTMYHATLGWIASLRKDWRAAAGHFQETRRAGGGDLWQKRHAQAALKAGMDDRAVALFRVLAKKYPEDPNVHLGLAIARTNKGWTRSALSSFSKHAALDRDGIAAQILKAVVAEVGEQWGDPEGREAGAVPSRGVVPTAWKQDALRTIARTRKQRDKLAAEYETLRDVVSTLVPNSPPARRISSVLLKLHQANGPLAMAMAQSLAEREDAREAGIEALIHLHERRNLHRFVLDLAEQLPESWQFDTCLAPIAAARSKLPDGDATGFVERWLDSGPQDVTKTEIVAALDAALTERSERTVRRLIDRFAKMPDAMTEDDPVRPVAMRADAWLRRRDARPRAPTRRLGLLGYHAPIKPSTNVGDYVQTIAAAGLIARSLGDAVRYKGPAGRWIERCVSAEAPRDDASTLEVVFCDRDDTSTAAEAGETFVLVNGWFMHKEGTGAHNFPFAPTIRPLFLAMHIARPEMLDDEAIAYLKRYAPVGARDHFTLGLLRANGIPSFFNGCPTLTLDLAIGRHDGPRHGRYYAAHRVPAPDKPADSLVIDRLHTDPPVGWRPYDDLMAQAWSYLEDYKTAEHVETPLLHCHLPCRALDTPSTFTHPRLKSDTRFKGVIGITDARRDVLKEKMLDRVGAPLRAIASGAPEAEIYRLWRKAVSPDVEPLKETALVRTAPPPKDRTLPKPVILSTPPGAGGSGLPVCHVAMAFDANLQAQARVTFRSLMAHATGPVHLIALVRGAARETVTSIVGEFPQAGLTMFEMDTVLFKDLHLLAHTTASTMDRLLLPELLPDIDKCVYVDVDTVIRGNIRDLFDVDLHSSAIGARRTQYQGWDTGFSLARLIDRQLGDDEMTAAFRARFILAESLNYPTFNAGVMVMDLNRLREVRFTDWAFDVVGRFGINDQFTVNLFAAGDFHEIGPRWNHFPTQEIVRDAQIVHYIGRLKPWDATCPPAGEIWRSYLTAKERRAMIPFAGFASATPLC